MKPTLLCALVLFCQSAIAQSTLLDTPIQLERKPESIQYFLNLIRKQTGVEIFYDNSKVDVKRTISPSKTSLTVSELLKEMFNDQSVQFIEQKNNLILKARKQGKAKVLDKKKVTVKGYLKDGASGEALIGSTVMHLESLDGSVANYYGFYSITIPAGSTTLKYSYVGYDSEVKQLLLTGDTTININLSIGTLDEVIINSDKMDPIQETTEMGTFTVTSKQVNNRPAIGGEVDLIKVLQLLPGVQSGNEGSAGIYVRGGGPDQNLILLDGVPIYNANHLFGFMSVFNTDAINNVKLVKGAFPARYGGRLSSVIDISMKEGNDKEFHGEGSLGLISTKLFLEGPIIKNKTSFAVSGRRTYADLLAQPFIRDNSYVDYNGTSVHNSPSGSYYFYDLTAKVNHKFSDKDRAFFSVYHGKDKGRAGNESTSVNEEESYERYYNSKGGLNWGSTVALLRWNHLFSRKLFSNTSISYSTYDFNAQSQSYAEKTVDEVYTTRYDQFDSESGIEDWSAKIDFDYYPSPSHSVKFGVGAIKHVFDPNIIAISGTASKDTIFNSSIISAREYMAYVEDDFKISRMIRANIGFHLSGFKVNEEFYSSFQPRVSFRLLLSPKHSIKASYTQMAQYLHLLTNPGLGVPTDFWVPATDKIPPQRSQQYSLGWFHSDVHRDFEFSIEAYYKQMNDMIEYKEGAGFINLHENWQEKVEIGEGTSYGMEFFIKKSFGKTDGWIGYTLSKSDRYFEELNGGHTFPFKYDRRHDLSTVINHQLNKKIFLSANWIFGSGTTLTLPVSTYIPDFGYGESDYGDYHYTPLYEYTARNAYRMRPYHRLDFSIRFNKKKKWGERDWIIGFYNLYNRKNPYYIKKETVKNFENETVKNRFVEYTLFPIIPSVSYRFKF